MVADAVFDVLLVLAANAVGNRVGHVMKSVNVLMISADLGQMGYCVDGRKI